LFSVGWASPTINNNSGLRKWWAQPTLQICLLSGVKLGMRKIEMKGFIWVAFLSFVIILFSSAGLAEEQEKDTFQKVNFLIDFSDYYEGSVDKWLRDKGFTFERGARDRKLVDFDIREDALVIEANRHVRGFIVNEPVDLEEYSNVRIKWGVIKYPEGASYEKKINNEALMVFIFFGYDKISSGHFLIPNQPYFVGLFLGKDEKINKPYKGRYFHKSGRFICLGNPKPNETVISEFNLINAFQTYFEKDEVPVISGIALATDTTSSGDGGKAAAFIKSIEFLE
jgi:hypothetical protein